MYDIDAEIIRGKYIGNDLAIDIKNGENIYVVACIYPRQEVKDFKSYPVRAIQPSDYLYVITRLIYGGKRFNVPVEDVLITNNEGGNKMSKMDNKVYVVG